MTETIIVWGIVGVVGILSVRSLYRTFTGKVEGCSCSTGSCEKKGACALPEAEIPNREQVSG